MCHQEWQEPRCRIETPEARCTDGYSYSAHDLPYCRAVRSAKGHASITSPSESPCTQLPAGPATPLRKGAKPRRAHSIESSQPDKTNRHISKWRRVRKHSSTLRSSGQACEQPIPGPVFHYQTVECGEVPQGRVKGAASTPSSARKVRNRKSVRLRHPAGTLRFIPGVA